MLQVCDSPGVSGAPNDKQNAFHTSDTCVKACQVGKNSLKVSLESRLPVDCWETALTLVLRQLPLQNTREVLEQNSLLNFTHTHNPEVKLAHYTNGSQKWGL